MEKKISEFKETMRKGMIQNYKNDGELSPVLFFLKDNQPTITQIPNEFLESQEGKSLLAQIIRNICVQPNVFAAGMIIEAFGAKMDGDDQRMEKLNNGDVKVSELDDRQDIIVMIFSTPEKEELISYVVNEETKEVGEEFGMNDDGSYYGGLSGLFSGFFNWNKN